MSLYKGNNLISGAMPNSANQSLSNLNSAGQDKFDAKVDLDLTNVNNVGYIKMAGAGMPSNTVIPLTLGASGTTYNAPTDGYFVVSKNSNASGQYLYMDNGGLRCINYSSTSNTGLICYLPVMKQGSVTITYNAGGSVNYFHFVPLIGSESEVS